LEATELAAGPTTSAVTWVGLASSVNVTGLLTLPSSAPSVAPWPAGSWPEAPRSSISERTSTNPNPSFFPAWPATLAYCLSSLSELPLEASTTRLNSGSFPTTMKFPTTPYAVELELLNR